MILRAIKKKLRRLNNISEVGAIETGLAMAGEMIKQRHSSPRLKTMIPISLATSSIIATDIITRRKLYKKCHPENQNPTLEERNKEVLDDLKKK